MVLMMAVGSCRLVPVEGEMPPGGWERVELNEPQMGVPFRIVGYVRDREAGQRALRAAMDRVQELNGIMSDYETDSELNRMCYRSGTGEAVVVSEDLWRVLERAQELAWRTGGALDVTVGPYVGLWRKARREKRWPDPGRLEEARGRVGYEKVMMDWRHRTVTLQVPEMRLDLGALAKGYALDEAIRVLRSNGVTRALISGGGDMVAWDPPPGKEAWLIEVAPGDYTNGLTSAWIQLKRAGLATSGDTFQRLEIGGRRYSHIVNPHTGIGLTDHSLVTVVAGDGMTADSLATAVSVLGMAEGMALVESEAGAGARIVRESGGVLEMTETRGFRALASGGKDVEVERGAPVRPGNAR